MQDSTRDLSFFTYIPIVYQEPCEPTLPTTNLRTLAQGLSDDPPLDDHPMVDIALIGFWVTDVKSRSLNSGRGAILGSFGPGAYIVSC